MAVRGRSDRDQPRVTPLSSQLDCSLRKAGEISLLLVRTLFRRLLRDQWRHDGRCSSDAGANSTLAVPPFAGDRRGTARKIGGAVFRRRNSTWKCPAARPSSPLTYRHDSEAALPSGLRERPRCFNAWVKQKPASTGCRLRRSIFTKWCGGSHRRHRCACVGFEHGTRESAPPQRRQRNVQTEHGLPRAGAATAALLKNAGPLPRPGAELTTHWAASPTPARSSRPPPMTISTIGYGV
jgi:hypothetical protein